jgi:hypothetical protein
VEGKSNPAVHEVLAGAGIAPAATPVAPQVRGECARLARLLRARSVRALGLAPCDDRTAVPAVSIELARALAAAGARPAAVMDAAGSWSCAGDLVGRAPPDGPLLATSWLQADLAVLTPRAPLPRAAVPRLRICLGGESATFGHLVVDLTGFEQAGDQLAAFDLLDGVVVVARSGRATARQIERRLRDVPGDRRLGVLLTGA